MASPSHPESSQPSRKPPWLKVRAPLGKEVEKINNILVDLHLHTVCREAVCPNIRECMGRGTATFLILGNICTRSCGFCAVKRGGGKEAEPDFSEAGRVAEAVRRLQVKHAVITSVTRDDLADGGARLFALTIKTIRELNPLVTIEVLIPDFCGSEEALNTVLQEKPDVLNHNLETVCRLYPLVRPQANYYQSLALLRRSKERYPLLHTKSGFMVGLGEKWAEIWQALEDLRKVSCDLLTVGQYLRPSQNNVPVRKYYHPDEFYAIKRGAEAMGFKAVASGALVRSSHRAAEMMGHN